MSSNLWADIILSSKLVISQKSHGWMLDITRYISQGMFVWLGSRRDPLPSPPRRSASMLKAYSMCDVSVRVPEVSNVYSGLHTSRTKLTLLYHSNQAINYTQLMTYFILNFNFRLGTGWSVRTNRSDSYSFHHEQSPTLSEDELHHIYTVVSKANTLEVTEKHRIGYVQLSRYQKAQELNSINSEMVLCGFLFWPKLARVT